MAATTLPEHLIEAGRRFLSALDEAGLQAQGAAWIFDHALSDWRFVVASSLVDSMGRTGVYKMLLSIMSKLDIPEDMTIADVHLIGTESDPLFQGVARVVSTGAGLAGITRFVDCSVNGYRFDAAIYRWTTAPADKASMRKLERHFRRRVKELTG
jgi:hypothetical protein